MFAIHFIDQSSIWLSVWCVTDSPWFTQLNALPCFHSRRAAFTFTGPSEPGVSFSLPYSPYVSSLANDSFKTFTGARSCRPHHSHFSHGRQNRRSSFCSARGDNLVTIARFGKPLFANMHLRVYAVAGALRKPNVACPHPDISTGWPVMWSMLNSHSADASVLTFLQPKGFFFCICTLR